MLPANPFHVLATGDITCYSKSEGVSNVSRLPKLKAKYPDLLGPSPEAGVPSPTLNGTLGLGVSVRPDLSI